MTLFTRSIDETDLVNEMLVMNRVNRWRRTGMYWWCSFKENIRYAMNTCDFPIIKWVASKNTWNAMKLTNQINNQCIIPSTDVTQLTLTLKMTTTQVVETSATAKDNSPIQDHVHLDDQTQPTFEMTPDCVQIFHTTTLLWRNCSWSYFEYQHAIRNQNYFQKLPVSRSKYHYSPVLSLADDRRWSGIDNKNTTQPQQSSMT